MKRQTIILSLGGSIIVPDKVNVGFLKKFRRLILDFVKKGHRVVIITGGGQTNRVYNKAAQEITKISDQDLDWLGISCTKLNAELIRAIFSKAAYEKVLDNPYKKIKTNKKIIVGSGWYPGWSSDKAAVVATKNFQTRTIINLTNVPFVYDKNPKKFKKARPLKQLSWSEYLRIKGGKWKPRLDAPFDPVAARLAKKLKLEVRILKGTNLANLKKALSGQKFRGTVIHS